MKKRRKMTKGRQKKARCKYYRLLAKRMQKITELSCDLSISADEMSKRIAKITKKIKKLRKIARIGD